MFNDFFCFSGRLRRGLYARRMGIVWGVFFALLVVLAALRLPEVFVIPIVGVFLWSVTSLLVRRLHDMGLSGWFAALCLLFLALSVGAVGVQKGTEGPNKYGDDPLATS